jgi:hypothetical protein
MIDKEMGINLIMGDYNFIEDLAHKHLVETIMVTAAHVMYPLVIHSDNL